MAIEWETDRLTGFSAPKSIRKREDGELEGEYTFGPEEKEMAALLDMVEKAVKYLPNDMIEIINRFDGRKLKK